MAPRTETDIDPELFYDASNAFKKKSEELAAAVDNACAEGSGPAAGTNGVGPSFADAYADAATVTMQAAYRIANAHNNVGTLLRQNGINHDTAEDANKLRDGNKQPIIPPGMPQGDSFDKMPGTFSIEGGDKPVPDGWELLSDATTMCSSGDVVEVEDGWPNGDPMLLEDIANGWKRLGTDLAAAVAQPPEEARLATQKAKELPRATARMSELRTLAGEVGGLAATIGEMTSSYGKAVATAQEAITARCKALKLEVSMLDAAGILFGKYKDDLRRWLINQAAIEINGYNRTLRTAAEGMIGSLATITNVEGPDKKARAIHFLRRVPKTIDPDPAARVGENQRKGRLAEHNAGIRPEDEKPRWEVNGRVRIPDQLDGNIVREVKNVNHLYATQQLKDMVQFAASKGYDFVIVVDQRTTFSPTLATELANQAGGGVKVSITKMDLNKPP